MYVSQSGTTRPSVGLVCPLEQMHLYLQELRGSAVGGLKVWRGYSLHGVSHTSPETPPDQRIEL